MKENPSKKKQYSELKKLFFSTIKSGVNELLIKNPLEIKPENKWNFFPGMDVLFYCLKVGFFC